MLLNQRTLPATTVGEQTGEMGSGATQCARKRHTSPARGVTHQARDARAPSNLYCLLTLASASLGDEMGRLGGEKLKGCSHACDCPIR